MPKRVQVFLFVSPSSHERNRVRLLHACIWVSNDWLTNGCMDSYCCLKRCSNLWSSLCVFLGIGRDAQMTVSTSTSSIVVAGVCGRLLWYGRCACMLCWSKNWQVRERAAEWLTSTRGSSLRSRYWMLMTILYYTILYMCVPGFVQSTTHAAHVVMVNRPCDDHREWTKQIYGDSPLSLSAAVGLSSRSRSISSSVTPS
jgi:hypothetical protein